MHRSTASWLADGALLLVAISWGLNFTIMKWTLNQMTPLYYLAVRFALSTVVMLLLFGPRLRRLNRREWLSGLGIGFFLFAAFAVQTIGLTHTTPGKSGFITGLNVVFVPLLHWALSRRFPGLNAVFGAVLATVGLAVLSLNESLLPGAGDLLTLACAFFFSLHILAISRLGRHSDPLALATIQVGAVAIGTSLLAFAIEPWPAAIPAYSWGSILFGALIGTVLAFSVQTSAQKLTPPSHTALILSAESMFAGVFSVLLWGETLTARSITGAGLIVAGIVAAEMRRQDADDVVPAEIPS